MLEGIDISKWQGSVNWDMVPFGQGPGQVAFVILRVSVGTGNLDERFHEYYDQLKDRDVELGYYMATVETQNGRAQADVFLDRLQDVTGGIPRWLHIDFERDDGVGNSVSQAMLHDCVYRMRERAPYDTDWRPFFYSSKSKINELLQEWGEFPDFLHEMQLWIAHYGVTRPALAEPWTNWRIHQNTSSWSIPGFSGNVDHNFYNGGIKNLRVYTGKIPTLGPRLAALKKTVDEHLSNHPGGAPQPASGITQNIYQYTGAILLKSTGAHPQLGSGPNRRIQQTFIVTGQECKFQFSLRFDGPGDYEGDGLYYLDIPEELRPQYTGAVGWFAYENFTGATSGGLAKVPFGMTGWCEVREHAGAPRVFLSTPLSQKGEPKTTSTMWRTTIDGLHMPSGFNRGDLNLGTGDWLRGEITWILPAEQG